MAFKEKKIDVLASAVENGSLSSTERNAGPIVEYIGEVPSAHYGELRRTFKARHIQMICLGSCIGSGFFISTGKTSLHLGGAPAMIIGYSLICSMALAVMNVLSEATCIWPTSGNFIDHAARFVDPAMGFAIGFSEWFAWMTTMASEGAIVRVILSYWTDKIPTAACITVYLAIVFFIHSMPNRWFAEFVFGINAAKVVVIFIILFSCIAMLAGAGPTGSTSHNANYTTLTAFPNGFKGVCITFTLAAWATGGQEIMGISAGEAKMPRWDMPRACTSLFIRILVFYELSLVFITTLVPYNDERLLGSGTIASSPFVIALANAGIKVLPDILNVVMIIGLCAIGAESMYMSSRVATAMARMGMLPRVLGRVDKKGRPYYALAVTAVAAIICTYINCSNTGGVIFTWFTSISATTSFIAWMVISITNVQMHKALRLQNDPAWKLPYAFKLGAYPATTLYLFITSLTVLVLTGYVALFPIHAPSSAATFFETFLGVPVFLVAYIGYKLWFRTKLVNPAEVDLHTGRRPLDDDDIAVLDAYYAQPIWKRVVSYVRF